MTHFYAELLKSSEAQHQASVAAAAAAIKGPTLPEGEPVNLRIQKPLKPAAKSDAMLAQLAKEEGKEVELNDDNQIVDRVELLSAGLNLAGVNTRRVGGLLSSRSKAAGGDAPVETHRAAGTAATKAEIRARQAALLERQMEEEKDRISREKDQRDAEERERVIKRKNNEDEVQSAKQRYLERKKRKLDEEAGLVAASGESSTS